MFFQISPVRTVKTVQKAPSKKESEEATYLSLAPFTPKPKIFFEDVKVGVEAARELIIKNPTNQDVELQLVSFLPEDLNVTFNWHRALINAGEDCVLRINWTPLMPCACRENIILGDGKKIKKDVSIIFKSVESKNKKTKRPTFLSKKVKSPPPADKILRSTRQTPRKLREHVLPDITETTPFKSERLVFDSHMLPLKNLNWNNHDDMRRGTYTIKQKVLLEEDKENLFDDSLERKTTSEKNLFENLKQLAFTPQSSPYVFQPTFCSSEEKSRSRINDSPTFSVRTYVINRENNISTKHLTYTKDLNNTSLKTIDFAQRSSFLCSSMKEECKKRTCSPIVESVARKRSYLHWDPFLLATTSSLDPFLTLDFNGEWIAEQEQRFTKWLNVLLTPPSDLQSNAMHPENVAKMWRQCSKQKEITFAPTKELVSSQYHTSARLVALREAAMELYKKPEIISVLKKVVTAVESGKLMIRDDRDLHLDLSLQSVVMSLLLSYNPLWLRIGLETIYSTTIPLKSNSDIIGLSQFLLKRFFCDPFLLSKHKTALSNKYSKDIKKFMLKKYLTLVYFLDQAKTRKLIKHDPCLFCKNAPVKQSKEMLFQFCKEVIHAIGDITKFLRYLDYVVNHQQTCLDEFDYAVTNLGVDLRDGVRLTRIVEIVLLKNDLIQNVRVPTISRLQKIHNVKIAFTALQENGFKIISDINPRDIVDGHKEKTLSFLWQILFKFEAPFLTKSASTIQKWWRSLPVVLKRRMYTKEREKQRNAVLQIEIWYKRLKVAKIFKQLAVVARSILQERRRINAAIKIQSYYRMYVQKMKYLRIKQLLLERRNHAAVTIQHFFHFVMLRRKYLRLKSAVLTIEKIYIAKKLMQHQLSEFQRLRTATMFIQKWYRSVLQTRKIRNNYIKFLWAVDVIQTRFKAKQLMIQQRKNYLRLLAAVKLVQHKFRAKLIHNKMTKAAIVIQSYYRMRKQRKLFCKLRSATVVLQKRFRATLEMKNQRLYYLRLQNAIVFVQQRFRANKQRLLYLQLRSVVVLLQTRYRALKLMRIERTRYLTLKQNVLVIQRRYRTLQIMKKQRTDYLELKRNVILMQRRFRALKLMKKERTYFLSLKKSVLYIEQSYKARCEYKNFQKLKSAAVTIQRHYRALQAMRKEQNAYLELKRSTIVIQRRFRALIIMKQERLRFVTLKKTVLYVEQTFKAHCEFKNFQKIKNAANVIQKRFRALQAMRRQRLAYLELKRNAVVIQRRFRALRLMKQERSRFVSLKKSVLYIEQTYQARCEFKNYLLLKRAAIVIQRRYRALQAMRKARNAYLHLKRSTIAIQRRLRALNLMKKERSRFLQLKKTVLYIKQTYRVRCEFKNFQKIKKAAITIQKHFRALQAMREQRIAYLELKRNVVVIQRRFRALKLMKIQRLHFLTLKKNVLYIEQTYRAHCEYKNYQKLRNAALTIQKHYKALQLMRNDRSAYLELKRNTLAIQRRFRALQLMKKDRMRFATLKKTVLYIEQIYIARCVFRNYQTLKKATVIIQTHYRALKYMQKERRTYLELKRNTIVIQRRFRALKLMQKERQRFITLKQSVLYIEQTYKAHCEYKSYQKLKNATIIIQRHYRAHQLMKKQRNTYLELKWNVVVIQQKFRALKIMKTEREQFLKLKRAAVVISRYYKAFCAMKKERAILLCKLETVYNIQRYVRGVLVRRKYGDLRKPEVLKGLRQKRMEMQAAVKIQSFWRGYKTKKAHPHLAQIRKRLVTAALNATPTKILGHLKTQALQTLISQDACLGQILLALQDLEFITRRCKTTCQKLCDVISEELYITICGAGRSVSEMDVCTKATSILINFCKYSLTTEKCWHSQYMDNIITVMQNCCDKEYALFCYLCTLLWLFAHKQQYKQYILQLPNVAIRLDKIQKLVNRRQNMASKMAKRGGMTFFGNYKNLPKPSLKPDWGLDLPQSPRTFTNAMHAFNCFLEILTTK